MLHSLSRAFGSGETVKGKNDSRLALDPNHGLVARLNTLKNLNNFADMGRLFVAQGPEVHHHFSDLELHSASPFTDGMNRFRS